MGTFNTEAQREEKSTEKKIFVLIIQGPRKIEILQPLVMPAAAFLLLHKLRRSLFVNA
jgi:hypothetical protein